MSILSLLVELFWPTRCSGCDYPGELFCQSCSKDIVRIDPQWACPQCGAPFGFLVCTECQNEKWALSANFSLSEFRPPLSRSIVLFKDHDEKRLSEVLGALLAEGYSSAITTLFDFITWIPATEKALKRRGFDHARELSRNFALSGGYEEPKQFLARGKAKDQRTLSREERVHNVLQTFSITARPSGKLLVIDDVFTTGATMNAAARTLLDAGATEVFSATLARVW